MGSKTRGTATQGSDTKGSDTKGGETTESAASDAEAWWRSAVIYQIYPRSFADASGDGVGDLPGITDRLPKLAELAIDAIWLSPFFTSPQRDAGYDVADYCDVDPVFGTLGDFDRMMTAAHSLGLKVIIDLVPNHTSSEHPWFRRALASPEGSPERDHYLFRDGQGPGGELPPNNWQSVFGGSAWSRVIRADGTGGQWYLHLFDSSQPDLNWADPWVQHQFHAILRFWLDRGVDGFRVDVAHGLVKADGLPDFTPSAQEGSMGGSASAQPPYWGQDAVHEIYRDWRRLVDEYDGDRVLCAEAWVSPLPKLALWVRPDEMHQAFNFSYLSTPFDAASIRRVIDDSLEAFEDVGAPSTWVLSNHDVVRHASRLALTAENLQGHGIGPSSPGLPDIEVGLRRARAATCLMLALPGSSYLFQGEELGLPEVIDLPDAARQDPSWFRTAGERYGRDGCRVPIPWEPDRPSYGFGPPDGAASWLPQPTEWAHYARSVQEGRPGSTLELYRAALAIRRTHRLGSGTRQWLSGYPSEVLAFRNGPITVITNLGAEPVPQPQGVVILTSGRVDGGMIPTDTTVWMM